MAKSRADKMYAGSPKIAADENGKKFIDKGFSDNEKKAARTSDGTEGIKIHEIGPLYDKHLSELSELKERHLKEMKAASPTNSDKKGE